MLLMHHAGQGRHMALARRDKGQRSLSLQVRRASSFSPLRGPGDTLEMCDTSCSFLSVQPSRFPGRRAAGSPLRLLPSLPKLSDHGRPLPPHRGPSTYRAPPPSRSASSGTPGAAEERKQVMRRLCPPLLPLTARPAEGGHKTLPSPPLSFSSALPSASV